MLPVGQLVPGGLCWQVLLQDLLGLPGRGAELPKVQPAAAGLLCVAVLLGVLLAVRRLLQGLLVPVVGLLLGWLLRGLLGRRRLGV
jgi:hypothetical protein